MSSNDITISAQGLSKCYPIFRQPKDRLKQFIVPTLQRMVGARQSQYFDEFWSLRDVSLEIRRGDTVGIIGRNGAGKSTLLQILCGTLEPTQGSCQTHGRVAALLELGSGFNPEFSGRDNVYLNASLLGLKREEIDARFEAIVAFADIGEFIDQPVKTYSSGMYVRLAFAVIAHVDADILVVDEALAVGDAIFTQKCMRFIRSFQERGTLLFVSHDMASVQNLCQRAIWLHEGQIRQQGSAQDVAEEYLRYTLQEVYGSDVDLQSTQQASHALTTETPQSDGPPVPVAHETAVHFEPTIETSRGWKTGHADIQSIELANLTRPEESIFKGGERVRLTIQACGTSDLDQPILGFIVKDRLGQDLFGENTLPYTDKNAIQVAAGEVFEGIFEFTLPHLPNGEYVVMASVANGTLIDHVQHHYMHNACVLTVSSSTVRWGLVGVPIHMTLHKKS